MAFNSIERTIAAIESQPGWEAQRLYRRVLESWPALVGSNLARVCRPVSISRNILWVATASSVVAQDLSLKRYDLLKKLNQNLDTDFLDLRFSPAQWHANKNIKDSKFTKISRENTKLERQLKIEDNPKAQTKIGFARRLTEAIDRKSQILPICPSCQSPTPTRELERWQVCACCVARHWSEKEF